MLEQLIESTSHQRENRSRNGLFLITSALVLMLCSSFFVWSMFALNLSLTDDGLELSTLIAPVPIPAAEPPRPEPERQQPQAQNTKNEITIRQDNIARVEDMQDAPKDVSTTPNKQKARPKDGIFKIGKGPETDATAGSDPRRSGEGGDPNALNPGTVARNGGNDDEAPVMKKKEPEVKRNPPMKSGGVLNGQAKFLPKPPYPASARMLNIEDSVNVQVVIDERGNVISAKAVSGHQLLRQAAEQAARSAKFDPTYLTGQAVKVTGVIVYRFSNG
jgi:protein TonB